MILEDTVLILGAGASKPYGYPTAIELRRDIINNLIPLLQSYLVEISPNNDVEYNPHLKRIENLVEVFKMSSTSSFDLFLSRNKEYYEVGKQIITFLLADYELKSKFREDIDTDTYDWYFTFYEILTKDIVLPEEISKFLDNKVSIITFNYDRSLENFIYESLMNSFRSKQNEIPELMKRFKIIHVYGKIAPLTWELAEGVKYRDKYLKEYYYDYAKNIRIIYEERERKIEEIDRLITNAKKIYFLGFGYAQENLRAIGLDNSVFNSEQYVYGTALGLTKSEIAKSVHLIKKNNHLPITNIHFENCDSRLLLRNYL